ncbi:MAG: 4'-phosphopantetheinyl transferase superfamily protein [Actinomycetota bacterium]|nr:4'-phosphopantetheinyl transferase superfamily protein [Actinomycetota bacterium]MDQ3355004.1 4'-phosphopantetheinyl transferase superfamily protein [Actinomycetota bacterium]
MRLSCLAPGEVHVGQASVTAGASRCQLLLATLSCEEVRRSQGFRSPRRREVFVVARAMLRDTLAHALGEDPQALRFAAGLHGKPFLDHGHGLRFNLAHSGDVILCAVARDREVGVDVERVRPDIDHESIARRFFSPVENEQIASLSPPLRQAAFFVGWTRKEALMKAWGVGLTLGLDRFDVTMAPDQPVRLLGVRAPSYDATGWSIHDLSPGPGYAAALAVEGAVSGLSLAPWGQAAPEPAPRDEAGSGCHD